MLAAIQGLISSVVEVIAVCGFVFGVACRLPPSLTILLLSGVFWFVIARHFFCDIFYKQVICCSAEFDNTDEKDQSCCPLFLKHKVVPFLELIAFLMQLGALIAIPYLLAYTESNYNGNNKFLTVYILIPVTLTALSVVWSGWAQKYLVEPGAKRGGVEHDKVRTARLKSGE